MTNLTEYSSEDIKMLEGFTTFVEFKQTWWFKQFVNLDYHTIGLFCGNQVGKTTAAIYQYILRFFGIHPIANRNVVFLKCASRFCKNGHKYIDGAKDFPEDSTCPECGENVGKFSFHSFHMMSGLNGKLCPKCNEPVSVHMRGSRIYRFCSENLPGQKEDTARVGGQSTEIKNAVYPALKRWLQPSLIIKDITQRNPALTIKDIWGGPSIICEFVSYNMQTQGTAGVQRAAIFLDEQPPIAFLEEQKPRLLAENGDLIIGCTPAERLTFLYDDVFEKAHVYIRTPVIQKKFKLKEKEYTDNPYSIAVVQAATDDNPTLDKDTIEKIFDDVDDPDVLAIRRYGIFKQVSGRIFKSFDYNIHYIDKEKYFPDGIPHDGWVHGRFIDYHPHVPWAIINMSISQYDEVFIWEEYNPSPEKYTTREISREVAVMGRDYKFLLNLVDPLAVGTKKDGVTVLDDLNREFSDLKKNDIGTGGYWRPWDTKSTRGREEIRRRLKNSAKVGKPFNNMGTQDGRKVRLSTIWILNTCRLMGKSMRNWRLDEWANSTLSHTRDMKESPQQRWSHFNMCIEAAFKHPAFKARANRYRAEPNRSPGYFQGGTA